MGAILSWFRKPSTKELLREIQEELDSIQDQQRDVELRTRHIGRYVVYSFVLYLLVGLCTYWYWLPRSFNDWLKFSLPFAAFPPLVMMVKRLLHWYYGRQLRNSRGKVEKLKKKKQDILDQVMETETYKVAKEILQQYAPEQLSPVMKMNMVTTPRPNVALGQTESTVRRREAGLVRPISPAGGIRPVRPSTPVPSGPTSIGASRPGAPTPLGVSRHGAPTPLVGHGLRGPATPGLSQPGPRHLQGVPATPLRFAQTPLRGGHLYSANAGGAPGVPMPRPVAPRERGVMDRLIDYLMKEGPANSYALVCKQCESHNGMALKDDFPYMAYRCAYCHYWNPARKQRPPAPRLEPLVPPPPPPVVSSGSEASTEDDEDEDEREESAEEAARNEAGTSEGKDRALGSDLSPAHSSSSERGQSGLLNGNADVSAREAGQPHESSKELKSEVKVGE